NDFMMSLIKSRPDKVVHTCIDDEESFASIALVVKDSRKQRAGRADDCAPGFEEQVYGKRLQGLRDRLRVVFDALGEVELWITMMGVAESPADSDISVFVSVTSKWAANLGNAPHSSRKWFHRRNLRTDMHAYAGDFQVFAPRCFAIEGRRNANV